MIWYFRYSWVCWLAISSLKKQKSPFFLLDFSRSFGHIAQQDVEEAASFIPSRLLDDDDDVPEFHMFFSGITTYSSEMSRYGLNFSATPVKQSIWSWIRHLKQEDIYCICVPNFCIERTHLCMLYTWKIPAIKSTLNLQARCVFLSCRSCANEARRSSSKTLFTNGVRADLRQLGQTVLFMDCSKQVPVCGWSHQDMESDMTRPFWCLFLWAVLAYSPTSVLHLQYTFDQKTTTTKANIYHAAPETCRMKRVWLRAYMRVIAAVQRYRNMTAYPVWPPTPSYISINTHGQP